MKNEELIKYLRTLGLSLEESLIYVYLCEMQVSTPLLISRATKINRTKVYRLLEEMKRRRLVLEEIGETGIRISPAPIERIQELLKYKQNKVAELTQEWNKAENMLAQMGITKEAATVVRYYQGKEGIEQMVWNVLKAKSEIVGYTFRDLSHFVGEKFMSEFASEFVRRNLTMRDIYGDEFRENNPVDTNWGGRINSKYLPKKILSIPHQMDIYDETVSMYGWKEGEAWGTEIINAQAATMQKQLFELAWEKAKLE